MNLTIFDESEKALGDGLKVDPASLYRAFEQVADGRKRKGKRYPLPLLLTLLLLGKLAGETTISGIIDWVNERQSWLKQQLNWPKRFPDASFLRSVSRSPPPIDWQALAVKPVNQKALWLDQNYV